MSRVLRRFTFVVVGFDALLALPSWRYLSSHSFCAARARTCLVLFHNTQARFLVGTVICGSVQTALIAAWLIIRKLPTPVPLRHAILNDVG